MFNSNTPVTLNTAAQMIADTGLLTRKQATVYLTNNKNSPFYIGEITESPNPRRETYEEAQTAITEAIEGIAILERVMNSKSSPNHRRGPPFTIQQLSAKTPTTMSSTDYKRARYTPNQTSEKKGEYLKTRSMAVTGQYGRNYGKTLVTAKRLKDKFSDEDTIYAIRFRSVSDDKPDMNDLSVEELKSHYDVIGEISTSKSHRDIAVWIRELQTHQTDLLITFYGREN